jgi:hypothetical protein
MKEKERTNNKEWKKRRKIKQRKYREKEKGRKETKSWTWNTEREQKVDERKNI